MRTGDCRSGLYAGAAALRGAAVTAAVWLSLALPADPALADRIVVQDGTGDARARRTDFAANGPIDPLEHHLPDLQAWSIGTWRPTASQVNLFSGSWSNSGEFVRLELVFCGLVNPPGPLGCCGEASFEPFRYGPNPVNGYVEIDVDADRDTGGEVEFPQGRYLGNVARFGGLPPGATSRPAIDARAFDQNLASAPWVERSGEDFHLELVGWEIDPADIQRSDPSDLLFGPGETWVISAHLLHRSHAYSRFSSACCRAGVALGNYEPLTQVEFAHNLESNRTTVSLVYPLTNAASAAALGQPVEGMDIMFTNQNSIWEGLAELVDSAWAAGSEDRLLPEFALLAGWQAKDPNTYLDPVSWRIRVLVGGDYTVPQDSLFVWSDIFPNGLVGDVNGSGAIGPADLAAFDAYVQASDADPEIDADGQVNASVEIRNFGPGFSLYDLDYDGLVNAQDRAVLGGPLLSPSDFDNDADVDMADLGHIQACLSGGREPSPGCRNADFNADGNIDHLDLDVAIGCAGGPAVPADPACGRP